MIVAVIPTSDEAFQELWVPGGHFNGLDNRVISEYLHKGPCLSPVKLCHNLIDTEDQNYGPQTSLRRGHIEAVA